MGRIVRSEENDEELSELNVDDSGISSPVNAVEDDDDCEDGSLESSFVDDS